MGYTSIREKLSSNINNFRLVYMMVLIHEIRVYWNCGRNQISQYDPATVV